MEWLYKFINGLAIAGLLLSCVSPFLSPRFFWPVSFFGLSFTLWLCLSMFMLVIGVMLKNKHLLYMVGALLVCSPIITRSWSFGHSDGGPSAFRVVSFNASSFNHKKENARSFAEFLVEKQVDVAAIVEWRRVVSDPLSKAFPFSKTFKHGINTGVQVVSKHKIIAGKRIELPETYSDAAWVDVLLDGDTLRFFVLHLESNRLKPADYHQIKEVNLDDQYKDHALGMSARIRKSMKKRAEQARIIRKEIEQSPHPVVVCGDFNDTPQSYAYQKIKGKLCDAFVKTGRGWEGTFVKPFAFLRIDYILYGESLECTEYQSHAQHFSDHKLIFAAFTKGE